MRYVGEMDGASEGEFESGRRQREKMLGEPVGRLVAHLAVPTITSMLVTSIYNMADTFFVSRISTECSAAVGVVFPIMAVIQACGFTLGMGASSIISRKLGEKKDDEASRLASTAFFSAFALGCLVALFGNLFGKPFMRLVGSSDAVLPHAMAYARWIFFGAPFMCVSFVMNNVLRSEGKAFFAMTALTTGGVLNIILDPIFIYAFGLGISGAAIATLISQTVGFCIFVSWFARRKAICRIEPGRCSKNPATLALIVATGLPTLCRQGLASVATIMLNRTALAYGDSAVAAMTIVTKISMFIGSVMVGLAQGFTPVSGYNYGARRFDRVKSAYSFTVRTGFAILTAFAALCWIFAPQITAAFRDDPAVVEIGARAMRFQVAAMPLSAVIIGTNMLLQSTGQISQASFLACTRQGVFFIPAILILPRFFALTGVEAAQAASDVLSALASLPCIVWFFRKISADCAD